MKDRKMKKVLAEKLSSILRKIEKFQYSLRKVLFLETNMSAK